MRQEQLERVKTGKGFIAALDQSGGSTPKALAQYGVSPDDYSGEIEMFDRVHSMRTRMINAPAFTGDNIIGAILFRGTMERTIAEQPTADYLWSERGIVPFLKIDNGLAELTDGVQLMKPMPGLSSLLEQASRANIFGTKMRSLISAANQTGIQAVVEQQFAVAEQVMQAGLVPIIEPEVLISSADKPESEAILKQALAEHLEQLADDQLVMLKLSLPSQPDFYQEFTSHPNVLRVVALSGGYSQEDANRLLAQNHGVIASFSRALAEQLSIDQTDEEFNAMIAESISRIYQASTVKTA